MNAPRAKRLVASVSSDATNATVSGGFSSTSEVFQLYQDSGGLMWQALQKGQKRGSVVSLAQ
jgi:hypothetical protein